MSVAASSWAWEQIRDHGLPNGQALVLLRIADHADSNGFAYPGVDAVAEYAAMNESTVRRAVKALEAIGLLTREARQRRPGEGRGSRTQAIYLQMAGDDQPGNLTGQSEPGEPSGGNPTPTAESSSDIRPGDDQPGKTPGQRVTTNRAIRDDQPGNSDRPTGQSEHRSTLRNRQEPSENRVGTRLTASPDASESPDPDPEFSDDVERLVALFCDRLNERTQRPRPYEPTRAWLVAMDRLIRLDGRSPGEVEAAIEWVHRDEFWSGTVLSVPKLRERFDQLKLQARRQRGAGGRRRGDRTRELIERARAGMSS